MDIVKRKKEVRKILGIKGRAAPNDGIMAGVILLTAAEEGIFKDSKLAEITGYPLKDVKLRCKNFRKNGIFKRGKMYVDWADEEAGAGVAFILDCLCGEGMMEVSRN